MKRLAYTSALIGLMLIGWNIVDRVEQHTEARIAQASAYREGCLPAVGETAIIVSDGRVATAAHRSHREPPPMPAMKRQAEVAPTRSRAPIGGLPGRDEIDRVQRMSESEFGEYVTHLARMWAYGRGKRAA